MTEKLTKKNLINHWILNELALLQQEYFQHLEKKEVNFITSKLIKFTREKLSNDYLELSKITPWDPETKKTILFVYQQILVMLHPIAPFLTDYLYRRITYQEILSAEIKPIETKKDNYYLWQVDCLLLLISTVRQVSQKNSNLHEFYLELRPEWASRLDPAFDFNYFLEPLTKKKIMELKKEELTLKKNSEQISFVDLQTFGVLWYQEEKGSSLTIQKRELEKKLKLYETEWKKSSRWLANVNFVQKAPLWIKEKEQQKLNYYEQKKKEVQQELTKLENNH